MTHHNTSDPLIEYYSNKENCFVDIRAARKAFGSTKTTEEEYDAMEKGLGIMYLYCPEDTQNIVEATISEATWRRLYFNF
jgi:hypothetical protein